MHSRALSVMLMAGLLLLFSSEEVLRIPAAGRLLSLPAIVSNVLLGGGGITMVSSQKRASRCA